MNRWMKRATLCAGALLLAQTAWALEAGWQALRLPAATPDAPPTTVALYYPTQATARAVPMGPFTPQVAIGGAPEPKVKGLIVLSHGTGGSELGHTSLAQALARSGYLVAAMRHPGDNWQDRSLLFGPMAVYFDQRPRQASRVIDALLDDPQWKDRIARDARGPRVGAVGHSAGGYTVIALAGGKADVQRIVKHCETERATDPIFCQTRRGADAAPAAASSPVPGAPPTDRRVRAVVALAPLGLPFTAASLAAIDVPLLVVDAELDRWLQPRFHTAWIARHVPGVQLQRVAGAWHFAFMDKPGMPIPTDDGDIAADPPGFDRAALLARLAVDLPAFFDRAFGP